MIRAKKYQDLILAAVLFLYPLRRAAVGVDLMDAGYALGNYRFFDGLDEMWKLATYLANVAGMLLSHLPFGDTWVGMNVYTSLPIGMTAAAVYCFFAKRYAGDRPALRILLFLSEIVALSLCWAPSVILYHYLGYLMMAAASLLLFWAISTDSSRHYLAAGAVLGLCIAVRMPNVTYMALILPVWYACFRQRKTRTGCLIRRTGLCIGGYLAGAVIPLAFISIRYGVDAYPRMVSSLFGMTETATDYKPTSMVAAMFGDLLLYSAWLFLFAAYMAAGIFLLRVLRIKKGVPDKITVACKAVYLAGFAVVLRLCYGRGMFDFDYTDNFSMYKWVTVYLLLTVLACIWCLISDKVCEELKLWAVFVLVIIFITPLGSNNGLYPIMNALFVVAPVSMLMAAEAFRGSRAWKEGFAFRAVTVFVLVCTAFQSILYGLGFVFHDALPAGEERAVLCLQGTHRADGLYTTRERKEQLEALDGFLTSNRLLGEPVILYGDIPALAYLYDMEPALFTTWADLDSNALGRIQEELDGLCDERPLVILGMESIGSIDDVGSPRYQKLMAVRAFMEENGYQEIYGQGAFAVYRAASG